MVNKLTLLLFCLFLLLGFTIKAQESALKRIYEKDDLTAFLAYDKSHLTPSVLFQHSLNHGGLRICDHLLDEGADPNQYFEGGAFPLITAVNSNQPKIVQLLLRKGAKPDQQQNTGLKATALMYACSKNNIVIPEILVTAGADINLIDLNGDPAMNWAAYYGNTKVMQWLIDHGADLSIRSKHGMPVDVGLRLWHADSVLEVFRHNWEGEVLTKREKRLYEAVQNNDLKAAKKLLSDEKLLRTTDVLGTPMLQLAVQANAIEMTRLLLKKGLDPNQTNRVGMTPLAFAARFGHTECLDLLLKAGANPSQTGEAYRLTPLMGAAVSGDLGIAQRLLTAGADANVRDVVNQAAALHLAMLYKRETFTLWLLENGVDYEEPLMGGQYTTKSVAVALGHQRVVKWIEAQEKPINPLEGSWKLTALHYNYITQDTIVKVSPALQGRITFSEKNYHLLYNPWTTERKAFVNMAQPTQEEMQHAFQTLVFNSGSYTYSDSTVVTTSDIARVPGFEGGKQYYSYQIKREELHLTMYDETYPDGGKPSWYEKLKVLFILTRE